MPYEDTEPSQACPPTIVVIYSEVNAAVIQGALLLTEMAADNDTIHGELFLQAHGMQMLWVREASMHISMNVHETRQCVTGLESLHTSSVAVMCDAVR